MRLGNRYFYEIKREHRKNRRLHEPYEHFKNHKRYRQKRGNEKRYHQNQNFPRENVSEQTERKRNQTGDFAESFYDAHHESGNRFKINKFSGVFQESDRRDARNFNNEKSDDRHGERHVQIRVHGTKQRQKFCRAVLFRKKSDAAYARSKFQEIGGKNKQKNRSKQREQPFGQFFVLQGFLHVIQNEPERGFKKYLYFSGNQFQIAPHQKSKHD